MSTTGSDGPAEDARNRFFIWAQDASSASEFDPHERLQSAAATDLRYFYGLTRELDRLHGGQGITFLLTWHLDAFEERFRDAVVILVGDEKYQTPSYASQVRAIFKTGGTKPNPLRSTLGLAPAIAWRVALRELRNVVLARRRAAGGGDAPMFELPMGYYGLAEVPFVPFAQRSIDVFFAGSVESASGLTLRPRLAARRQMVAALEAARRALPTLRADYSSAGPFANPQAMLDGEAYSARLMQARIALCPRGNFDETFRLCEAAKSGCVAIVERLPERWYNRDAPPIQIDRWSSLPQVLEAALADPEALAERAERMRRWWTERLSETAVAEYVAASLAGGVRAPQQPVGSPR